MLEPIKLKLLSFVIGRFSSSNACEPVQDHGIGDAGKAHVPHAFNVVAYDRLCSIESMVFRIHLDDVN